MYDVSPAWILRIVGKRNTGLVQEFLIAIARVNAGSGQQILLHTLAHELHSTHAKGGFVWNM